MLPRKTLLTPLLATGLLFFTPISGLGQTTIPAAPQPAESDTYVLSPFSVTASKDVGYVASSSLAGSRLNSDLRDNAASISVLTAEFLGDIGASDLDSAVLYANNIQKNVGDQESGNSNGNSTVEFASNYRIRGIKANTARNYYTWNMPSDLYNVDRVDQSRGPNSILFGLGSAGGIINTTTKTARTEKNSYEANLVVASHDLKRASIDINQSLMKGVLAVRLNAVYEDRESFRRFESSERELADLALTWKPFARTTVKAQWETGTIDEVRSRPWGLIDIYSTWVGAGNPIKVVPVTSATEGILRLATTTARVTFVEQAASLYDLKGTMITSVPTAQAGRIDLTTPSSVNAEGPGATSATELTNYTIIVEQQLGRGTFLQLSFNHQDYDWLGYDTSDGDSHALYGDPNGTLNGASNRYGGSYFVETNWYRRNRREEFDTLRATAAHEFDLGRAGRHRLALMGESQTSNFWRDERREYLAGAPFHANPEDAANLVRRRSYVTPGDWSTYRVVGGDGRLLNGVVDQVSGRSFSSAWIQRNTNTDDDDTTLRTLLIGDQSYFFAGRLVLTAGYRRDELEVNDLGTTRDPVTKEIIVDYVTPVPLFESSGNTRTFGAVGHLGKGFSAFFNDSNSINLPIAAHRVLPDSGRAPNWEGVGTDYGLLFAPAGGKFSLRATRFTTSSIGETNFRDVINIVTNRNIRVLNTLQAAGQVTAADGTARTVNVNTARSDRDSEGYEFSLVANPTPQWRISANYSLTDAVESNVMSEVQVWADDAIAFWSTKDTSLVTSANVTIAQEIANLNTAIANQRSVAGVSQVGLRRESFNVFSRYDFAGGMRGLFVGGGWRYQSRIMAGRDNAGNLLYGPSTAMADALIGYGGKIGQRYKYSVQLNLSNLFDNTDPLVFRYSPDGSFPTRVQLVDGRTYRLSASLRF